MEVDNTPFERCVVLSELRHWEILFGPIAEYISRQIVETVDPNSIFAHWTARWLIGPIPAPIKIWALRRRHYDGLICYDYKGAPAARMFWQEHRSNGQGATANGRVDLHMFSVAVPEEYRGRGYAKAAGELLLRYAIGREDVCAVRFGRGMGVNAVILGHIEARASLGLIDRNAFIIAPQGWAHIVRPS